MSIEEGEVVTMSFVRCMSITSGRSCRRLLEVVESVLVSEPAERRRSERGWTEGIESSSSIEMSESESEPER